MKYVDDFHKRRSIRLKGYDYGQAGAYFITICCYNKQCLFGKVNNGKVNLNQYGLVAAQEWINTPKVRPNVQLAEWIVMPNHMHGVIILLAYNKSTTYEQTKGPANENNRNTTHKQGGRITYGRGVLHTPLRATTQPKTPHTGTQPIAITQSKLKPPKQTIGAIVRGYKGAVTRKIDTLRRLHGTPVWQRNYHEHIIRDEKSYLRIANYIKTNPHRWSDDRYFNK